METGNNSRVLNCLKAQSIHSPPEAMRKHLLRNAHQQTH